MGSSESDSITDSATRASQSSERGSGGAVSNSLGSRGSDSRSKSSGSGDATQDVADDGMTGRTCSTCPEWTYLMGSRRLGGIPYVYTYHHLYLVAWNRGGTGRTPTYSAFPSNQYGNPGIWGPISGALTSDSSKDTEEGHQQDPGDDADMGYLKYSFSASLARSGEHQPTSQYVELSTQNNDLTARLHSQAVEIDNLRIRYQGAGPNSNSFAMSLAERVGLPRRKPPGDAPGSGMNL